MAFVIPVNSNPCRTITVPFDNLLLRIRTYWLGGITNVWKMDISDGNSNPIASGISLVHGVSDLIKGLGYNPLDGYRFRMAKKSSYVGNGRDSLGNTEKLVVFTPSDSEDAENYVMQQILKDAV